MNIDDMSHDIQPPQPTFTPRVIARMTSAMRSHAPWLALTPSIYYSQGGFVWDIW